MAIQTRRSSILKVKTLDESLRSMEKDSLVRRNEKGGSSNLPEKSGRSFRASIQKTRHSIQSAASFSTRSIRNLFSSSKENSHPSGKNASSITIKAQTFVEFDSIHIREYKTQVDVHPGVSRGAALSLSWEFKNCPSVDIDKYENDHRPRKRLKELTLLPQEREERLQESGVTKAEITRAIKQTNIARRKRRETLQMMSQSELHEKFEKLKRGIKRKIGLRKSYKREEEDLWKNAEAYFLKNC